MERREQLAHDLAIVYLNNRHGADVAGEISDSHGSVGTTRLPPVDVVHYERVATGEKRMRLFNRTTKVAAGLEVDSTFKVIIEDYFAAYARFYSLLEERDRLKGGEGIEGQP